MGEGGGGSQDRSGPTALAESIQALHATLSRSALDVVSFKSAPTDGGSDVDRNGKIIITTIISTATIGSCPSWMKGGGGDKKNPTI